MTRRLAALTLAAGAVALAPAGHAQQTGPGTPSVGKSTLTTPAPAFAPPTTTATTPAQRAVYPVRGGDAAALAAAVGKSFAGAVTVTAVGDTLLLSGPAAGVDDARKLLDQIDRPAKAVVVEVTLAEVEFKKDDPAVDLSGPDALAKLDELAKAGQATVQRVRVSAVDGKPATATASASKPYTTAEVVGGGGGGRVVPRAVSINYRDMGTTVKLTARAGDDATAVDLSVERSGMRPADAADENGAAAPSFEVLKLATTVLVPPGRAVVAHAARRDGKAGRGATVVIVSARPADPDRKAAGR